MLLVLIKQVVLVKAEKLPLCAWFARIDAKGAAIKRKRHEDWFQKTSLGIYFSFCQFRFS